MSSRVLALIAGAVAGGVLLAAQEGGRSMTQVRLMTLDPGHFHAALVQKEMYPGVAPRVDVFAPLGPDLVEHLNRIAAYNRRSDHPTTWDVEVHTSSDYFERMLRDHPGNVVVFSGRNRVKIDRIAASVSAGLNVLGDKPWILKSEDLPKLEQTLAEADKRGVVAYDIMTERFEVTSILQRALVNDPATFGEMVPGTDADPGVYMESVHYLMKVVSGAPNIRPAWFFDTAEQGEGLNDIGTHLVDLVQWTLFPDTAIDYRKDVQIVAAQRWPTTISQQDFTRVTREPRFPATLGPAVKGDTLEYYCNTLVAYTLRGIHTKLNVIWDWEPPAGSGDTHFAFYRGTRARVEIRQGQADRFRPELYVIPAAARQGTGAGGRTGEDQGAAGSISRRYGRGSRRRDPHRDPGRVPRGPRGALRAGDGQFSRLHAQPERAPGVGTAEHAGEVLRDDEGHRNEPTRLFPTSASARALIGFLRRESFANQNL